MIYVYICISVLASMSSLYCMEENQTTVAEVVEAHTFENQPIISLIEVPTIALFVPPAETQSTPAPAPIPSNATETFSVQYANPKPPFKDSKKSKKVVEAPTYETQPWFLSRVAGYWSDDVSRALSCCNSLKAKPTKNATKVAHTIEWGINKLIEKAGTERSNLPKTNASLDQLQAVVRANFKHTIDLSIIINTCEKYDIQLPENILSNAYKYVATEDTANLEYAYLIIKETQERMKQNKKVRKSIYKMKHNKQEIGEISDDECTQESIFNQLSVYQSMYQKD